jgi:hypothetical protein
MTDPSPAPPESLPAIPVVDIGTGGAPALYAAMPEAAERLLAIARRSYTGPGLRLADPISRRWLERSASRHTAEVAEIAERIGKPGVWTVNLSFEWGCTTAVGPDPDGSGARMLEVPDWPLPGLGRELVVADHAGPAGPYRNLTWPAAVGVISALAPGRFALAVNQAPMRRFGYPLPLDWLANRARVHRSTGMPPAHLARWVCDTARDFAEARRLLAETEICIPAIFSLSGVTADQTCVIERAETEAMISPGPTVAANDWLQLGVPGRPRGEANAERRACLAGPLAEAGSGASFSWLVEPVLNPRTRLAFVANAATGRLAVQGYEPQAPGLPIAVNRLTA